MDQPHGNLLPWNVSQRGVLCNVKMFINIICVSFGRFSYFLNIWLWLLGSYARVGRLDKWDKDIIYSDARRRFPEPGGWRLGGWVDGCTASVWEEGCVSQVDKHWPGSSLRLLFFSLAPLFSRWWFYIWRHTTFFFLLWWIIFFVCNNISQSVTPKRCQALFACPFYPLDVIMIHLPSFSIYDRVPTLRYNKKYI